MLKVKLKENSTKRNPQLIYLKPDGKHPVEINQQFEESADKIINHTNGNVYKIIKEIGFGATAKIYLCDLETEEGDK